MHSQARIFVAGHRGLVGSALLRALDRQGYANVLVAPRVACDLRDSDAVAAYFRKNEPEIVFVAAARVGGIAANVDKPGEFLRDNLAIQLAVLDAARIVGVRKLLFLGSSCIYPRLADQPIKESALLTGSLESTNEAYAIAKIAGIKLCQAYRQQYGCNFICVMPTNLYGPNDNFDLRSSHVLPAMIRKFDDAVRLSSSSVELWGTGRPRREFLHVDDLADACLFLMRCYDDREIINVGSGEEISIRDLAVRVANVTGFTGDIRFDTSKADGTPRKLLDSSRMRELGWSPRINLQQGLISTYDWFKSNPSGRKRISDSEAISGRATRSMVSKPI